MAREREEQENAEKIAREEAEREAAQKKPATQKQPASKSLPAWLGVLGIILIVIVSIIVAINQHPSTPIPAATATFTTSPSLSIGSSMISPKDGMKLLYVPAGNFLMGSADSDPNGQANEKPQRSVYMDAFWIDQTDVTNVMYAKCVSAGACSQLTNPNASGYYGNSQFDNYPMIDVDWNMADAYCKWANRRLATEAQWEKAARGTNGRIYPWGNNAPDKTLLNYIFSAVGGPTAVGSYPNGASPYGALDMAGNVWQWVNDWYSATYYHSSPPSNPAGPDSGQYRVLRGGSSDDNGGDVRSAGRFSGVPTNGDLFKGIRCAMSATK